MSAARRASTWPIRYSRRTMRHIVFILLLGCTRSETQPVPTPPGPVGPPIASPGPATVPDITPTIRIGARGVQAGDPVPVAPFAADSTGEVLIDVDWPPAVRNRALH